MFLASSFHLHGRSVFAELSPDRDAEKRTCPMKKGFPMLLMIVVSILLCPLAFADTTKAQKSTAPVDVTSAAAAVPLTLSSSINLSDEEVLGIASPVRTAVQGLALQALTVTAQNEVEGPETEGPDNDGPGGPNHEFDGDETGQH
jgi:hypothetical protein